jgi:hypothetical protein
VKLFLQARLETKALKAKRPGFTDERYNETSYYLEPENGKKTFPACLLSLLAHSCHELAFIPEYFKLGRRHISCDFFSLMINAENFARSYDDDELALAAKNEFVAPRQSQHQ